MKISLASLLAVLALAGCGGTTSQTTPATDSTSTEEDTSSSEQFTVDNWDLLSGDPDGHKGALVDIIGRIFLPPERDKDGTYFQMYADPNNDNYNTIVAVREPTFNVKEGDFVHVVGTVSGKFKGQNAFGAELTLPTVIADTAEVVDATAAAPPALRTLSAAHYEHSGISITVDKVEMAAIETRVFVTLSNQSGADFSFFASSTKALQGSAQFEPEYNDLYKQLPSEIVSGAQVDGVIVFPTMDTSAGLQLLMEGYSDNSDIGEYGSMKWRFTWT